MGALALLVKAALLAAFVLWQPAHAQSVPQAVPALAAAAPEVRGTWLTTTANDAIASPERSAQTMRRLREIGLNTVYVEVWKNGYTQFPSQVLQRTLGVAQRPSATLQDPGDKPLALPPRDLLQETLIEAHRQGLNYVGWFEYGFMAAHKSTMNHLRRMKPEWLSRDIQGNEVAPNGFVWLNPLHPEARRFLLELTLEAIQRYDMDGVQFDDRIVWPYITMGYDAYTRQVYASEHQGRQPPTDARDPGWMRWRADKLNALAQEFVSALRAARPGMLVSLSPAVYPWSFEHYLLEWPLWARWPAASRWDEYVPQAYRMSYAAFQSTWQEQTQALQDTGAYRAQELVAGIRIQGDGPDSSWAQLRDSMLLARREGNGGHVLWFSRGVLDLYATELTAFYASSGAARSPRFPAGWRTASVPLVRDADQPLVWRLPMATSLPQARPRLIGHDGQRWHYLDETIDSGDRSAAPRFVRLSAPWQRVELIVDRRGEQR